MPPRTPLSVSPWSNSVQFSRMARPSTPIEIPHRHRPSANMSYNTGYADIFDMSPSSPSMAENVHAHAHRHNHGQEVQFMYHFPTYSSQRNTKKPSPPPLLRQQNNNAQTSASPPNTGPARGQPSPRHTQKKGLSPSQTSAKGSKLKQLTPVTVVGFTPLKPNPNTSSTTQKIPSGRVRLSPPPMSFSYSANPWILPGRGDTIEGESAELEGDGEGVDYEFDKHLMNRINSRLPVQRYGKPTWAGANHD